MHVIENGFRQIAQVFVPLTGVPGSPASLTSALSVIFSGQPVYRSPYSQQGEIGVERQIACGLSVSGKLQFGLRLSF